MAGKVTLYVRDEQLWERARQASGPAGLSDLVQRCLREWLEASGRAASAPSVLERARALRDQADALVGAIEDAEAGGARPKPQLTRRRRSSS